MKKFTKHKKDTTSIVYWGKYNRLITCSWDGKILTHDDSTSS